MTIVHVEGMDADIVQLILAAGIKPKIIQFEIQCLPQNEIVELMQKLTQDYMHFDYGNDRILYRKDFFKAYCDHIYIHYGFPTFYRDVLKLVARC